MGRARLWLLIGLVVVLAAFVSGLLRGITGTSPFEVEPDTTSSAMPEQ